MKLRAVQSDQAISVSSICPPAGRGLPEKLHNRLTRLHAHEIALLAKLRSYTYMGAPSTFKAAGFSDVTPPGSTRLVMRRLVQPGQATRELERE
jgi:hypothetical protein